MPGKRPVQERKNDYKEFISLYSPDQLNQQASRCMNCGIPFCHHGCPLGNIIPEFNDAVYREDWLEAYDILSSTNNFPEFTGRICPAPCESSCVLGINQPPVAIEEIEKHIVEIAFQKGWSDHVPNVGTGKKVAVGGLACRTAAAQLNYAITVTVFERDDAPVGSYGGIPDRKPRNGGGRRVKLIKKKRAPLQHKATARINDPLRISAIVLALARPSQGPQYSGGIWWSSFRWNS